MKRIICILFSTIVFIQIHSQQPQPPDSIYDLITFTDNNPMYIQCISWDQFQSVSIYRKITISTHDKNCILAWLKYIPLKQDRDSTKLFLYNINAAPVDVIRLYGYQLRLMRVNCIDKSTTDLKCIYYTTDNKIIHSYTPTPELHYTIPGSIQNEIVSTILKLAPKQISHDRKNNRPTAQRKRRH